jgi:dTDP-3-amino-3,4,6-trideoxy-alpha-D-glucopyranose N,N-dimethyltransferase
LRRDVYRESAQYYDALYRFKDYAEAARRLHQTFIARRPAARTLLDVACGTGRHVEHLRHQYDVEGVDMDPTLLAAARDRCPGVRFHQGDMRSFRLGRRFDLVTCLFGAIAYVETVDGLRRTLVQLAAHTAPDGLVAVEPWFTPQSYWVGHTACNVVDEPHLKIAWMYVQETRDDVALLDIHHLVGEHGTVRFFREEHRLGLFTHDEYVASFEAAGLSVDLEEPGPFDRGLYVGAPQDGA